MAYLHVLGDDYVVASTRLRYLYRAVLLSWNPQNADCLCVQGDTETSSIPSLYQLSSLNPSTSDVTFWCSSLGERFLLLSETLSGISLKHSLSLDDPTASPWAVLNPPSFQRNSEI